MLIPDDEFLAELFAAHRTLAYIHPDLAPMTNLHKYMNLSSLSQVVRAEPAQGPYYIHPLLTRAYRACLLFIRKV